MNAADTKSEPMHFAPTLDCQLTVAIHLTPFSQPSMERVGFRLSLEESIAECVHKIDNVTSDKLWMIPEICRAEWAKRERKHLIDYAVDQFLNASIRPKIEALLKNAIEAHDTTNGYTKEQDAAFFRK